MSRIVWLIIALGVFYLFYGARVFSLKWHWQQVRSLLRNEPTFASLITITLILLIALVVFSYLPYVLP